VGEEGARYPCRRQPDPHRDVARGFLVALRHLRGNPVEEGQCRLRRAAGEHHLAEVRLQVVLRGRLHFHEDPLPHAHHPLVATQGLPGLVAVAVQLRSSGASSRWLGAVRRHQSVKPRLDCDVCPIVRTDHSPERRVVGALALVRQAQCGAARAVAGRTHRHPACRPQWCGQLDEVVAVLPVVEGEDRCVVHIG